jgi:prepilin-type N-terminal cleavage/methylation domain-containing protein
MFKNKQPGFTIVELLIVIVIIGILAAITIVAYNGIQTRAENTTTVQAVGEYAKGIHAYAALNGSYPIDASFPCLGKLGTTCGRVTADASIPNCLGIGGASATTSFDTAMKTVFSGAMPQPSAQSMNCGGTMLSGAFYRSTDGKAAQIFYFLRGNQPCADIGGIDSSARSQQDDTTRCTTSFPTLP